VKRGFFSDEQLGAYRRDGFLAVPGLFDAAAMQRITSWTDEVQAYPEVPGEYMMYFEESLLEPGERVLSRIENICPYHEGFNALVTGDELLGRTSELLGEPAVFFKEKINFKLPGGGGFKAHQDMQAGWDTYGSLYITALVSIDEATVENGCLELAPGAHTRGMIGEMWRPLDEAEMERIEFIACPAQPGDVVFFDAFTPHRSEPNMTASPRRVLYVTYNRLSEGDHRQRYYADKRKNYPPDCEREPGKKYVFRV